MSDKLKVTHIVLNKIVEKSNILEMSSKKILVQYTLESNL